MKDFIVTQLTFQEGYRNSIAEPRMTLPSQTVPGMTMSMRELVNRYVRGEPVPTFTPQYNADSDIIPDNLERMDVQEKLMLAKNVRDAIQTERSRRLSSARDSDPIPPVVSDIAPHPEAATM